jgi:TIR domain
LQIKDQIFISHASEDKEVIIDPLVKCLSENGIKNYWYDRDFIHTGDLPVQQINEGLSRAKIGIIVFSRQYLDKHWTIWEMMVLLTLLITHKIRIIPFLSGSLTYNEVTEMYPILIPLRIEPLPACDKLVPIIKKNLQKACKVIENPVLGMASDDRDISIPSESASEETIVNNKDKSHGINEVNQKKLAEIHRDLENPDNRIVKHMAVTKIRNYSERTNVWSFKEWWEIVEFLIYSVDKEDTRDGVYILIEALKRSKRIGGDANVIKIANELFGHKLLEYITPDNTDRISNDSLGILEVILDPDQVYDICIGGLIDGIKKIRNDNEYTNYIQKFIIRLEKGNRHQILKLLGQIRILGSSRDIILNDRATKIFDYFHKIGL